MSELRDQLQSTLHAAYTIERELGAGGMATVYLAHDLRHERKVAIKVLRPDLAAVIGAERFLREIKTIATLQHPHILGLIDSGEVNGTAFYVMPFVEGESLRDRLDREKQLPIAAAVRIATEVAGAIDYAHRHGVIHRDIKPENVLLHDGSALVADFGIALVVSSAGASRMTETGMSLGTPHYMSPEQAMGEREITSRSDVYALGAMTYEMLVGEPPFTGPTAQAIVAKVLTAEPAPPSSIRKTVPPSVDRAVLTALEKLPADRFGSGAEFAAALSAPHDGATAAVHHALAPHAPWRRLSFVLVAVSLLLLALSSWALMRTAGHAGPSVYDLALPDSAPMAFAAITATTSYGIPLRNVSLAPNGEFAVYTAQQGDSTMLWYRSLRDAGAHPIPGTTGGTGPRISPDGKRAEFQRSSRIWVVPLAGGDARQLFQGAALMWAEWLSPTQVLASDLDGYRLSWLDADQGLLRSKTTGRCAQGDWVPQESRLLCTLIPSGTVMDPDSRAGWVIRSSRPDGSPGPLLAGSDFRLVENRYLLYLSVDGELRAAHYDPVQHLAGRSVTMLTGVRREAALGSGQYDLAANGTLVYAPGADAETGRLVRLSPNGEAQAFDMPLAAYLRFDLSPDGRRLAAVVQTAEGQELRIKDLHTGQQLSWLRAEYIRQPLWSPDGERLLVGAHDSTRSAILIGTPSSGLPPDTLASADAPATVPDPMDFQSDHLALAVVTDPLDFQSDHPAQAAEAAGSYAVAFDPSVHPLHFDTIAVDARFASLAPDGRHMVYQTGQGGRIIVTSYPSTARRWQVSDGGVEPIWLSATALLYRLGVSWYVVRIDAATGGPVGPATSWGRDPRFSDTPGWSNRASHDGGIIYVQGPAQTHASFLRVVPNWVAGMRSAVDGAKP